jgi:predicted transcriptional regulator
MGGYMATSAKQKVLAAVEKLPADATIEDAMERLYFLTKIDRGVADADAGRLTDHEEARLRFSRS